MAHNIYSIADRELCSVVGVPIDVITWSEALSRISSWAARRESRYICICNTHSVVTAKENPGFMAAIKCADMATPDGAPVAWLMRKFGCSAQERINGPDLMWLYFLEASVRGESVFLYGSTLKTLDALRRQLAVSFPGLVIAGAHSPPFRPLTHAENIDIISKINLSGASTVWVSLGCPKQELWMAENKSKINAVMIGVGAAFDYHSGVISRAPLWMQRNGLEWLHRFLKEPRRLWKRYLISNFVFLCAAFIQLIQ